MIRAPFAVFAALVALAPNAPALVPQKAVPAKSDVVPEVRDVSGLLEPILERQAVPGMVAAVVSGKDLTASGAAGLRERGRQVLVTLDDRFHLGSCTKAMTATLAAMIVEDGVIGWDTSIAALFPKLEPKMDPTWRQATLEHFLTHRAGTTNDLSEYEGLGAAIHDEDDPREARRILMEGILAKPPLTRPGKSYRYSNNGYCIGAAMLERVTRKSWEQLIRERLFVPLGMTTAGFGPPASGDFPNHPRGHGADGEPLAGFDNPVAYGPAGTVHMTIADWARFVAFHLRGEKEGSELLSKESFQKLHTPIAGSDLRYAMGWIETERPWAAGRTLWHNGSNTAWFAVAWLAPNRDFAVVVACNQGGPAGEKACDEAAVALINDHLAQPKRR